MAPRRTIEVDGPTAVALEQRAAETGRSVAGLLADIVAGFDAHRGTSADELAELDRQWAAIKAGEPTVSHDKVARWLDSWGTPAFKPWAGR